MIPPDPIFVHRAGVKNTVDFALLWHLALCGLTGSRVSQLAQSLRLNENTLRHALQRLDDAKLAVPVVQRDEPGHPIIWVCSRLGYRLMTGHLKQDVKALAGGQMPLGDVIDKTA